MSYPAHGAMAVLLFITYSFLFSCQPSGSALTVYDIRDFGAVGDSTTLNTAAIQSAVDRAFENGGGTVVVKKGVYLTGTIFLKDNITLRVEAGARIKGSPNIEDYAEMTWGHNKDHQPYHLIMAKNASNIAIESAGIIDDNGPAFWQDPRYRYYQNEPKKSYEWSSYHSK